MEGLHDPEPALPVPRAALQAQCNSVWLGYHQALAFQVWQPPAPLATSEPAPLRRWAPPRARFPGGLREDRPGRMHKAGLSTPNPPGGGVRSGGSVRAVPQPSRCQGAQELPAPGRGLGSGASRHPDLPAAVPSDLPSLLPVCHKSRNGDFRARYLFECRRLLEVQLPNLAGLEPGLSGYGWKAGLSQQASVVQPSQAFLQTDSALGQSREGNGEAGEAPWQQGSVWQGAPRGAWGPLLRKGGRVPWGSWLVLRPPSAHAYPFKQPRSCISPGLFPVRSCAPFSSPWPKSCPAGRSLSLMVVCPSASRLKELCFPRVRASTCRASLSACSSSH